MVSSAARCGCSTIFTLILFAIVMASFVIGTVAAMIMCPGACDDGGSCPDTCKLDIKDPRLLIPIIVCGVNGIFTLLFAIRAIWMTIEDDRMDMAQLPKNPSVYDKDCLVWHGWIVLVVELIFLVINGLIILGFLVQGRNWNYSVITWFNISFHTNAGGVICWCWYPFGARKKKEVKYLPLETSNDEFTKTAPAENL
jgi:hypothetical protein